MFLSIIFFILGLIFLIKGADIMIDGSSSIAKKFNISSLVIGLTIVAFGTSAPELIVSAVAALKGSTGIALGNIIGSNIANTLLVLGIAAIIYPLIVKKDIVNKQIPFSLLAIVAVGILINDFLIDYVSPSSLTRIDGLILILFFSIFIYYTFSISKAKEGVLEGIKEDYRLSGSDEIKTYNNFVSIGMIIAGLVGLFLGGRWVVNGAIDMAKFFGMSEILIGLTIVAVGTSLPELAASAMAAKKGQADMAIGNVVGSNIFNLFWVLGVSAIINPITYNLVLNIDMLILLAITILLLFLIYTGKRNVLTKKEGITLLVLYICYLIFLVSRG